MDINWSQITPVIVPALIALFGGVAGYFLKYYLDKKAQFTTQNAEVKRDAYQKFVDLTVSFFIHSKKSQKQQTGAVDQIADFYKQYVLYGSPKVVRAFAGFMQIFYKREALGIADKELTKLDLKRVMGSLTRIYKAMRKDIGLSNRFLGFHGTILMRAIVKDYDQIMKPKFLVWFELFLINLRSSWRNTQDAEQSSSPYDEEGGPAEQSGALTHKSQARKKKRNRGKKKRR